MAKIILLLPVLMKSCMVAVHTVCMLMLPLCWPGMYLPGQQNDYSTVDRAEGGVLNLRYL